MEQQIGDFIQPFFLLHRQFAIPRLGTVYLKPEPAFHDFSKSQILPDHEVLEYKPEIDQQVIDLFDGYVQSGSAFSREQVLSYLQSLYRLLRTNGSLDLAGIGSIHVENNTYHLTPLDPAGDYYLPVTAKAVIHEGALHDIKVGEAVHTNAEMKTMLAEKKSRDNWWIYALLLVLVAAAAMVYYLYSDKF